MILYRRFSASPAWIKWCAVGGVLLLWFIATDLTRFISAGRFPSPSDVYEAAVHALSAQGYAGGTMWTHILRSCWLIVVGFFVASTIGVPLGLLMGWSRTARSLFNPVFSLIRPIPPLAWIPLSMLWFGLEDSAKVFVICLSAFVPCVINSYVGIRDVDPVLVEAARVHGASRWNLLFKVLLPGALPMTFTGLRIALQVCWSALVAAELVGSAHGLGHVLHLASLDLYPGMILFAMAIVGLLGAAMTKGLGLIESRLLRWTVRAH